MTELKTGPRTIQAPETAPGQEMSLDVGLGGRGILEAMHSFGSHPLLGDAGAVIEAIRTGGMIIARTAPGQESDYGSEQDDSPATGYRGSQGRLVFESQATELDPQEHGVASQQASGMMVSGRGGVRFGSSQPEETEVAGSNEDSVERVVALR